MAYLSPRAKENHSPIRLADKPWLKILLIDLLWKNKLFVSWKILFINQANSPQQRLLMSDVIVSLSLFTSYFERSPHHRTRAAIFQGTCSHGPLFPIYSSGPFLIISQKSLRSWSVMAFFFVISNSVYPPRQALCLYWGILSFLHVPSLRVNTVNTILCTVQ